MVEVVSRQKLSQVRKISGFSWNRANKIFMKPFSIGVQVLIVGGIWYERDIEVGNHPNKSEKQDYVYMATRHLPKSRRVKPVRDPILVGIDPPRELRDDNLPE